MSGIVGLLNTDGSPVDLALLGRMTERLAFRGPDRQQSSASGNIGFGHTLLATTDEAAREQQPFTLDGRVWIVADARVDARSELIAELTASAEGDLGTDATDAELILRAYLRWGEEAVERLLGDFAFAVWDAPRRTLFCARDQMGVKPFFYAQTPRTLAFSNTLECLRLHPSVSDALNDQAIADFLLFGVNQERDTTTFHDIKRLPPAHCLTWSRGATRVHRYWTLPVEEPLYLKRADEYEERFRELLRQAVGDRLRTSRVGVFMSGGLDSPTLAAGALAVLKERQAAFSLVAITSVYDTLIPDSERHYAGLVADYLNIPILYDVRDNEKSLEHWAQVSIATPEPVANPPTFEAGVDFARNLAAPHARVFLYGEGPDNALRYEWREYLAHLLAERRPVRLVRALSDYLLMNRRVPLSASMWHAVTNWQDDNQWKEEFPSWLNSDFATRMRCRARWEARHRASSSPHAVRPEGYRGLNGVLWQAMFEDIDITSGLSGTEVRHPFVDVRILRYMLRLPAIPWCRSKLIIRRSMRGALPDAVLRRKKTSVLQSPTFVRARESGLPRVVTSPELLRYVEPSKIPAVPNNAAQARAGLRSLGLSYWLQGLAATRRKGTGCGAENQTHH